MLLLGEKGDERRKLAALLPASHIAASSEECIPIPPTCAMTLALFIASYCPKLGRIYDIAAKAKATPATVNSCQAEPKWQISGYNSMELPSA
jgi:hypothetical protein